MSFSLSLFSAFDLYVAVRVKDSFRFFALYLL